MSDTLQWLEMNLKPLNLQLHLGFMQLWVDFSSLFSYSPDKFIRILYKIRTPNQDSFESLKYLVY